MKKTRLVFAAILVLLTIALGVTTVYAEEAVVVDPTAKTIVYVAFSWFCYFVLGLLAALSKGEQFDSTKFLTSLFWAFIVMLLAIGMKISPAQAAESFSDPVNAFLTVIMNTGPAAFLIYSFDKLYTFLSALFARIRAGLVASQPKPG